MLTERQLIILQTIIDDFIESAHPVGSRAISKKENISLSAATIRNVMADLEDMDLLEKTHSSSGRIPSEKGYRYYVDHVIAPTIKEKNIDIIKHIIQDGFFEFEQVVQMSAEILSELTNYTSIILGPDVIDTKLVQIQMIKVSPQTVVAILVTDSGHVEHRSFSIPTEINVSDLEKMVNILNDRLTGIPIVQLSEVLKTEVYALMKKHVADYNKLYSYLKTILSYDLPVKIYIGGKSNILMQPEFRDIDKVHSFYSMMENEDVIVNLLKNSKRGIKVTIGNENKLDAIKNFSLITASYQLGVNQLGTIALLGPTRMEYRKVITLLKALANEMTEVLHVTDRKK